ncbi:hypothetical protein F6V25_02265 [Oryzomonas japonica]|uniref:Uncharacterized protein n=1 Tax=Oryzomonas japonica TaxID=2603858 RepID=A0A7J4ZVR2_9BACT|nr:hypothetical protein [Oryzomonas japonica]KAB0667543.1 hypothetical protein F6V25_02265 [Oryzomonas japonica]
MKIYALAITLLLLMAAPAVSQQPMRPYSGIGVLLLAVEHGESSVQQEPFYLYEEPAVQRIGVLDSGRTPPYEWLFTGNTSRVPLIVTARKGEWLQVAYDDAGRLGWLEPRHRGEVQPWSALLKGKPCRLLPGLRKQYYQIFRQPGKTPLALPALAKQSFRVVKLDGDWALAMPDQSTLGWLRWRDEDGRLLISVGMDPGAQKH